MVVVVVVVVVYVVVVSFRHCHCYLLSSNIVLVRSTFHGFVSFPISVLGAYIAQIFVPGHEPR